MRTLRRMLPTRGATSDWLSWLGGGDRAVLQQVPRAHDRFVQMGLVMLTTSSLAVVSMTFALHDTLDVDWLAAAPFGLFWGFVVLNLDRFLVVTMGTTREAKHLLAMAAPRLAMAVVLAAVISTPLVLRVFQSDIATEMHQVQLQRSISDEKLERESKASKSLERVEARIEAHEATLNGNLPAKVSNPALAPAQARLDEARGASAARRRERDRAYEAWQCELYGAGTRCHRASKRRGAGPLAAAKERQYRAAERRLETAQDGLRSAQVARDAADRTVRADTRDALARAQEKARSELPELRKQQAELAAAVKRQADDGSALNAADDGILAQVSALWSIGERDKSLMVTHLLVALLFFFIEILPVLGKVLLNLGPLTAYDVAAQLEDEKFKDKAKIDRLEARHVEERRSETRVGLEDHMRDQEKTIGETANVHVAQEMTAIVQLALEEWSERVRAQLATGVTGGGGQTDGHRRSSGSGPGGADPNGRPSGSGMKRFATRPRVSTAPGADGYGLPDEDQI